MCARGYVVKIDKTHGSGKFRRGYRLLFIVYTNDTEEGSVVPYGSTFRDLRKMWRRYLRGRDAFEDPMISPSVESRKPTRRTLVLLLEY